MYPYIVIYYVRLLLYYIRRIIYNNIISRTTYLILVETIDIFNILILLLLLQPWPTPKYVQFFFVAINSNIKSLEGFFLLNIGFENRHLPAFYSDNDFLKYTRVIIFV